MVGRPTILGNVVLSNGNLAVLAGNPYKAQVTIPDSGGETATYTGFDDLQVAILSDNTPFTLNQSAGNISFPAGDSPNQSLPSDAGVQGDATTGGATIAALPGGGMAILAWGDSNLNYTLQILSNTGAVVTAPVVIASQYNETPTVDDPLSSLAGNPVGAVAAWSGGLVVAYNTDNETQLYMQRYTLTGTAVGTPVLVASPSGSGDYWYGSMAVDSSGDVIFGFGSSGVFTPGSYKMFSASNAQLNTAGSNFTLPAGAQSGIYATLGSTAVMNNGGVSPFFVPLSGGGFATVDYFPVGTYDNNSYPNFNMNIQEVSTSGAISTPVTVANAADTSAYSYSSDTADWIAVLPNGNIEFQESRDYATTAADIFDPGTASLSREAVTAPGPFGNLTNSLPVAPTFAIAPAYGSETNVVGVAINGSNQLVAEGVGASTPPPNVTESLVSDTGSSNSDNITSNDAVTGGGDANAVVTLTENTTTLGTTTANGSGSWTFTPSSLSQGANTIIASETNSGGTGSASLTFTYDTTPPSVTSDDRVGISPNTGGTEQFAVVFSEAVTGVTVSSFTLADTGSVTGTIGSVSGSGTSYTVTVTGATGSGTMALDLKSSGTGIQDIAGNAISGGYTGGQSYTITQPGPTIVAGATATFTGGGSPVTADGGLTITDPGSTTLASATVDIASGYVGGDTLNFINQNGITGSYNAGTLSLTGTASVADYQAALDSITYRFSPSDGDPTNGGGDTSRTLDWSVNDGVQNSGTVTSTINAAHVAPSVTVAGTVTFDGGGSPVTLDSTATVSDPDSGGDLSSAHVIIGGYLAGDTLTVGDAGGLSTSFNSGTLTLSGPASLSTYTAALDSVAYSFNPTDGDPTGGGFHPGRTILWDVSDGSSSNGASNVGNTTLTVVHVAPTISAGGTVTFDAGGSPVALDPTATATDPDSGGNLTSATISINSGFISGDTLTVGTPDGLASSFSNGTLTLTGTASLATYNTALDSVAYSSTVSDPTSGGTDNSRSISWTVNDGVSVSATGSSVLDVIGTANFNVHVYYDTNGDGSQDNGETGLAGVTVDLLDGSGNPTGQSATTNASGDVSFTDLALSSYEVSVVTPNGDFVTQATNLNTPNTLTGGETASATEGVDVAPAGTYVPPGATAPVTDQPGTYSLPGSTAPSQAPPGSFVPTAGATAPTLDTPGFYNPSSGASVAIPAPPGSFVPTAGATAPTLDTPGFYNPSSGASVAIPAPPGSFVPTAGATAPTLDTPGFYNPSSGASVAIPAPPGSFVPTAGATAPTLDTPGFYNPSSGASAAIPAPPGSFVPTAGATAPTLDTPGFYNPSSGASAAIPAPPGSFVPTAGATAPTLDTPGFYNPSSGASAAIPAPPGSFVPTAGATAPTLDTPGFYNPSSGASAAIPAPPGSFVPTAGATAPTLDTPGFYNPSSGASAAIPAPPGSFVPTAGATAPTLDTPGFYNPSSGASVAIPAPPGSFVPTAGATAPTLDTPGFYNPSSGASAAIPAPPGSFVPTAGATAPTLDAPGFYNPSSGASAAIPAPPGSFVPTAGATAPTLDAPGFYNPSSGASAAIPAPPGSFVPTAGATAPTTDPVGTYTASPGATAPTQSPAGTYVGSTGATAPTPDPTGTYTNTTGATAPTVIPAGFYDTTPSGTPIAAPAGTYIPGTGSTSPGAEILAPAGYYDAGTGNTAPKIDPAGSYTGSPGSTAPILAPTGTYLPTAGATAPTVAPPGYYDPGTGNTAPILLPVEVWAKGVSGSWQTAANWNPAMVPGATTNAELTASGTYRVTSSATTTVGALRTASGATLDITAGTFTLAAGTGTGTNAGTVLVGASPLFTPLAFILAPELYGTPASSVTSAVLSGAPTMALSGPFANTATGVLLANDATIDMIGGSVTGGYVGVGLVSKLEATGGSPSTISSTLGNIGIVDAGSGTSLTLSGTTYNAGVLEATGGGTLTITGPLVNWGVLAADGGNVTVSANQIGSAAQIYSGSKMTFLGSAAGVAASFMNNAGDTGELVLAKAASSSGTVAGFFYDGTHSDTLDLGGINFASGVTWSFAESSNGKQGVLTVADHSGDTAKITLLGGYLAGGKTATSASSSIFQLASDGATPTAGTLVTTKVV